MTLKQIYIKNLRTFRKKEGLSQMKLAEYCDTATSYIGDIEIGRRFPSMEMIEKIATVLKVEPYHFFRNSENNDAMKAEKYFPCLPNSMKKQIHTQIKTQIDQLNNDVFKKIEEILNEY